MRSWPSASQAIHASFKAWMSDTVAATASRRCAPPRHRARVRIGADRAGVAIAPAPANPRDDADRGAAADQHRPLLDVHLDIAPQPRGIEVSRTAADRVDIAAELRHMLGHAPAGVGARHLQDLGRQPPESRVAPRIRGVEPRGLFRADRHDDDVEGRSPPGPTRAREERDPGHHAGGAVVIAALRHRVQVRADNDRRRRPVAARQRRVAVPGSIDLDLQIQAARDIADHLVRELLVPFRKNRGRCPCLAWSWPRARRRGAPPRRDRASASVSRSGACARARPRRR